MSRDAEEAALDHDDRRCCCGELREDMLRFRRDLEDAREKVEKLTRILLRRPPDRRGRIDFVVGKSLDGVIKMSVRSFVILAGQTLWLGTVFQDDQGVQRPLGSLPTGSDTTGTDLDPPVPAPLLAVALVGAGDAAPAASDKKFFYQVSCPQSAVAGTAGKVTLAGVNPDGVPDDVDVTYTVGTPDDTTVVVDVETVAP